MELSLLVVFNLLVKMQKCMQIIDTMLWNTLCRAISACILPVLSRKTSFLMQVIDLFLQCKSLDELFPKYK